MNRKIFIFFIILLVAVPTMSFLATGTYNEDEVFDKELIELNQFLDRLDNIDGLVDRSAFDIEALAQKYGLDRQKLFNYVRDEIGYHAYRGVMRGAEGMS